MCRFTDRALLINDKEVRFEYPIRQLIKFDMCIVILLDDEELPNNIVAYDYHGIILWKINDILKIENPGNFTEIKKVSNNILGIYYVWGIYYEVDMNTKEILKKEYTR